MRHFIDTGVDLEYTEQYEPWMFCEPDGTDPEDEKEGESE